MLASNDERFYDAVEGARVYYYWITHGDQKEPSTKKMTSNQH